MFSYPVRVPQDFIRSEGLDTHWYLCRLGVPLNLAIARGISQEESFKSIMAVGTFIGLLRAPANFSNGVGPPGWCGLLLGLGLCLTYHYILARPTLCPIGGCLLLKWCPFFAEGHAPPVVPLVANLPQH
jgi:hypothetical protein